MIFTWLSKESALPGVSVDFSVARGELSSPRYGRLPLLAHEIAPPRGIKRLLRTCRSNKGVLCTAKKKGGGGGEEARGFTTVRGAPQNGDGRVEADFAIMLSRITKFVFFFQTWRQKF